MTWMFEDVIEMTTLFVEKGIKSIRESATRIRRTSDSGAEVQNFEDVNCLRLVLHFLHIMSKSVQLSIVVLVHYQKQ